MTRRNFPQSVRAAVIKRATSGMQIICEGCGLPCKRFEIDHIRADALLGDNTIENAQLLCKGTPESCHDKKTAVDRPMIDKAKAAESRYLHADRPKSKIPRPPKAEKQKRDQLPIPPRRDIFSREIVK